MIVIFYGIKMKRHVVKWSKLIIMLLLIMLLIIISLWFYFQNTDFVRDKIIDTLESYNIRVASFDIEQLGMSQAILSNIKLSGHSNLTLNHLMIKYSFMDLIAGKLQLVEADNAQINIYKNEGKFIIGGLEGFLNSKDVEDNDKKEIILTDNKIIENILPDKILLRNFNISIKDANFDMSFPVDMSFELGKVPKLEIKIPEVTSSMKPYKLTTGDINSSLVLEDNKWRGIIALNSLNISGLEYPINSLGVNAKVILDEKALSLDVIASDNNKTISSNIDLHIPLANPSDGNMHINNIKFPLGEGVVSSDDIRVGFAMKKPVLFVVNVLNVDLKDILDKASEGKVKGNGKISGNFPITYNPDGSFVIRDGEVKEVGGGTISVSPDILQGSNAELVLARTTLENFHYTKINIFVSSKGDKSSINLMIEGKNPESKGGRAVKFNVNLTGDILPLIQQTIIPFNDVKKLLTQGKE